MGQNNFNFVFHEHIISAFSLPKNVPYWKKFGLSSDLQGTHD